MHDDDFDRRLAQRLRAYESRIPDADAPDPHAAGRRSHVLPLAVGGMAAVVVGGALGIALLNQPRPLGDPAPTATVSQAPSPSASTPTAAAAASPATPSPPPVSTASPATPSPTPVSARLRFTETGSFAEAGTMQEVSDMVETPAGVVAVGTHYNAESPQILGPLAPHSGRIWLSPDGASWEALPPMETFGNAVLTDVFVTADQEIVVVGSIGDGLDWIEPAAAWTSTDGRTWASTSTGLPAGFRVIEVEHGAAGYLALLARPDGRPSEVWHSPDGRTWELGAAVESDEEFLDGGAGDEGFVVIGRRGELDSGPTDSFAIASSDGRNWIAAGNAPVNAWRVAPLGGDWFAVGFEWGAPTRDQRADIWHSASGLDWAAAGSTPMEVLDLDAESYCTEYPSSLLSANGWLVLTTTLSYPCSEGGSTTAGSQRISVGGAWEHLTFGTRIGVGAALEVDGRLLLAGGSRADATFWIGEAQP